MTIRRLGPVSLAVTVGMIAALASAGRAAAQAVVGRQFTPADLFGVPLDATPADLEAVARRAGVTCVPAAAGGMVCPLPLVASPVATVGTFWFEGGFADRAFLVAPTTGSTIAPYRRDFALLQLWVTSMLGPATRPARLPPWWSSPAVDDRRRLGDIVAGRAKLEAVWVIGDATLRLWLAGEAGQPHLVLGLRREGAAAAADGDCTSQAIAGALLDLFPPADDAARAAGARRLADCRVSRAAGALGVALDHDPAPAVRAEALRALDRVGAEPDAATLNRLSRSRAPDVAGAAGEILAARRQRAAQEMTANLRAEEEAKAALVPAARATAEPGVAGAVPAAPANFSAAPATPGGLAPPAAPATPPAPAGPTDGTPLAIGASTVAGATLMRDLGRMGLSDLSAQLLIGGAGAVIGFGTSWGLSRFGFRPTLGQAVLYTNTTAWGTLAGYLAWSASGSNSTKLEYGSLVLGQAAGMGLGVWSARQWRWTPEQTMLADSFLLGAGLTAFGFDRVRDVSPPVSVATAVGAPIAMVASAIAAHAMDPTGNDLRLMSLGALGGGWSGGLLASGGYRTALAASPEGQGGMLIGAGIGYLATAAAGAFSEAPARSVYLSSAGMVAGNLLGLGLHMALTDGTVAGAGAPTLTAADRDRWKLGAGIGGLALGAAAYAYAPYLRPGESAPSMSLSGILYGGGLWGLATAAGYHGQTVTDVDGAHLQGGMLAGAVAGGVAGLVASRWFEPEPADQLTVAATTGAGVALGLGVAKLTTDIQGTPDSLGVLAGAGGGFLAGVLLDRNQALRPPDFAAGAVGAGYGAIIGALAPTLHLDSWNDGRKTAGGAWFGTGAGAVGGALLARLTSASGAEVAVPATAGLFGLGIGYGAGLLWSGDGSQPARIGTVAGPIALMGGALLAEHRLRLADGLGQAAVPMGGAGALFGGAWGLMLAGVLDESGFISDTPSRQLSGGALMGASAGMATGLVLSKFYDPSGGDIGFTFATSAAGAALGLGLPELIYAGAGRHDTFGALVGSVGGMLGGALLAPRLTLAPPELAAGFVAGAYGALIGTLAPTMFDATWDGGRKAGGGALVGLSLGAAGAVAAAHLDHASAGDVAVGTTAGAIGIGAGLGAGLMWPTDSLRPARIGTVVGPLALTAVSLLAEPRLRLADGLGPDSAAFASLGALYGIADGLLVAGAVDPSGLISETPARRAFGGALLGASAETATGLVLSKYLAWDGATATVLTGGKLFGGLLGLGSSMLLDAPAGRTDTLATLGGSIAGLAGAAVIEKLAPLEEPDLTAVAVGLGFGGFLGALAPHLNEPTWQGFDRKTTGGTLAGLSLGAFGAAALRRGEEASTDSVGLAALGGADGLLTGLGFGILADGSGGGDDRGLRIGMAAGTAAGLGIGMAVWPRLTLGPGDRSFIAASTAVGGWTAFWIPALGHVAAADFDGTQMKGALLAGAGVASFGASLLTPALQIDDDLLANAMAMDVVFSGAGAGIGALASRRADAPVWGLLAGGTAGLLAGGALHRSIDLDQTDTPLLTLAGGEGIWLGAWLPYLIRQRSEVTDTDRGAALAGAALGTLGVATLASGGLHITGAEGGYTALGSAIGASVAGGAALLSPSLHGQEGVGLMLGGTGLGLLGGALLSPGLELRGARPLGAGALGGLFGASEALVFAWSARADQNSQFGGSVLIGAGVGAALGIATGAASDITASNTPAAAGFAAWGAWMGSFAGSLFLRDPHEIVLGGLAGANVGFLGGYILVHNDVVEPRDFGWLSLFGALGTVAGAAAGAPFSSTSNPTPVLAGLAIGPAVGMLTGALALPRLRKLGGGGGGAPGVNDPPSPASAASLPRRVLRRLALAPRADARRPALAGEHAPGAVTTSADVVAVAGSTDGLDDGIDLGRLVKDFVEVTDWAPMVGALPGGTPGDPNAPTPLLVGVTGRWK